MQVRFNRTFIKNYKKSSSLIQKKFNQRLKIFLENEFNPILNNHALQGEWKTFRSINITGDWRAIYMVESNTCIFVALGTHSELYS